MIEVREDAIISRISWVADMFGSVLVVFESLSRVGRLECEGPEVASVHEHREVCEGDNDTSHTLHISSRRSHVATATHSP